jgi:putative acetyltransferase
MLIRGEQAGDEDAVRLVVAEAFENHPHGDQREHVIVDALREAGALSVSLVAEVDGGIAGHIAFSQVRVGGAFQGWYGLGPVAVRPQRQGTGIGQALVRAGLERLEGLQAAGCVVVGEPAYYGRFGFKNDPGLRLEGIPPEFFLALSLRPETPSGVVEYHPAFSEVG